MKLSAENVICRLRKISNNTLKMGDGAFETEFTIPVEGYILTKEQLNQVMSDPYTWRSWFNWVPPNMPTPCAWWAHSKGEFPIPDEFIGDWLEIRVSGDRVLEFESEDPKGKKGEKKPAYRITNCVLTPKHGGHVEARFHLHVRPGIGKENLILQEHQHSEVRISFSETKPKELNESQGNLDLAPIETVSTPVQDSLVRTAVDAASPEETQGATAEAQANPPQVVSGSESPREPDEAFQQALAEHVSEPGHYESRSTVTSSETGESFELRSGKEIDDEMAARRAKRAQQDAAKLLMEKRNDELKQFESQLAKDIEARKDRPSDMIDGTTRKH